MQEGMNCPSRCACHKMVALGVVLIGLVFLLGALDMVSARFVAMAWPILLILIGLKKMMGGMCSCCSKKS